MIGMHTEQCLLLKEIQSALARWGQMAEMVEKWLTF